MAETCFILPSGLDLPLILPSLRNAATTTPATLPTPLGCLAQPYLHCLASGRNSASVGCSITAACSQDDAASFMAHS